MMNAIEKRARELLAAQIENRQPRVAKMLRVGFLLTDFVPAVQDAVAAIIAALTPPEGFVLVPVEMTKEIGDALNESIKLEYSAESAWDLAIHAARPDPHQ